MGRAFLRAPFWGLTYSLRSLWNNPEDPSSQRNPQSRWVLGVGSFPCVSNTGLLIFGFSVVCRFVKVSTCQPFCFQVLCFHAHGTFGFGPAFTRRKSTSFLFGLDLKLPPSSRTSGPASAERLQPPSRTRPRVDHGNSNAGVAKNPNEKVCTDLKMPKVENPPQVSSREVRISTRFSVVYFSTRRVGRCRFLRVLHE